MKKTTLFTVVFLIFVCTSKSQLCFYAGATLSTANSPTSIVSANLNGDSHKDIIVGSQSGLAVYLGNGDGTFTAQTPISLTAVRSLACADLNQDGHTDVIALQSQGQARVLLGNGTGSLSLSATGYPGCIHPLSVLTDDFNNDNKADLVITNFCLPYFHRYYGDGMGGFVNTSSISINGGNSCYDGTSGDFNKDGFKDLALTSQGSNDVSVFLATGTDSFSPVAKYPVGSFPEALSCADFDADGNIDIATAISGSDSVAVLFGSSSGLFSTAVRYKVGLNPRAIEAKDINGDGQVDLIVANNGNTANHISVLVNSNGVFAPTINFSTGSSPYGLVVDDFNNDGINDFASANTQANTISLWLSSSPVISGNTSVCPGKTTSLTATWTGASSFTWNTSSVGSTISVSPVVNTVYTLSAQNSSLNCSTSKTIQILVLPVPSLTITSSNSISCAGESVSLTAMGANSYSWNVGGTSSVLVATNLQNTFVYTLSGTNTEGCTSSTAFTQSVLACTGISANMRSGFELSVYPNPSKTHCNVSTSSESELDFELSNLIGQTVLATKINKHKEISVSELQKGVYIYSFKHEGTLLKSGKLILE